MSSNAIFYIVIIIVFSILIFSIYLFLVQYIKRQVRYRKEIAEIRRKNEAELLRATLATQEKERERIGANLHDDIGPLLSSFKMYFNNELKSKMGDEKEEVETIIKELDHKIEHVRSISREMVPNVLKNFGFKAAVEDFVRRFENYGNVRFDMQFSDHLNLDNDSLLSLYRIIQEGINNAIRHGNASDISIKMNTDNGFYLKISDNGEGFSSDQTNPGLGLRNMEARAKSIDGVMELISKPGNGTSIIIKSYDRL